MEEGKKLIRRSDNGKTVEIRGTDKAVIKIRNCKVAIESDSRRYEELKHIEN